MFSFARDFSGASQKIRFWANDVLTGTCSASENKTISYIGLTAP